MTRYEQEVVINFNAEEKTATVYTANPLWMRKMDRLVEASPEEFKVIETVGPEEKPISKTYECPKDLIRIHVRRPKRVMTEEEREAAIARLKKAREIRKLGGNNPETPL